MNSDELRALADCLDDQNAMQRTARRKAADYLRAQADAQPVPASPQAEPKREPLSEEQMRAVLIAEARRIAVQAGEKDPDSLTLDEEMLAQVMLAGRAVERAHGIGGSDAE